MSAKFASGRGFAGLTTGLLVLSICAWLTCTVEAYIPASPTNDSSLLLNGGSPAELALAWFGGSESENVRYVLMEAASAQFDSAPLLHFSEQGLGNEITNTPWIAFVACDANSTDSSLDIDVFNLARDRGAVAALLYSAYSDGCTISPAYSNPLNFDYVMDVLCTQSLAGSLQIEADFNMHVQSAYRDFNATLLNQNAALVNATLTNGTVAAPGYIFANLVAAHASATPPAESSSINLPTPSSAAPGGATQASNGATLSLTAMRELRSLPYLLLGLNCAAAFLLS